MITERFLANDNERPGALCLDESARRVLGIPSEVVPRQRPTLRLVDGSASKRAVPRSAAISLRDSFLEVFFWFIFSVPEKHRVPLAHFQFARNLPHSVARWNGN